VLKRLVAARGASYIVASPANSHGFATHIYATHIYPKIGKHRAPPESEIMEIDATRQVVSTRLPLDNVAGVFHVAISQDGRLGIATMLRPKNLVPLAHVEHGWAFGDSIAVFGEDIGGVVELPLDELERYFSLPFGVAIAPDKSKAYLSASGSNEVAILDLNRVIAAARSPRRNDFINDLSVSGTYVLAHVPVGRNPRGIALSGDGRILYVATVSTTRSPSSIPPRAKSPVRSRLVEPKSSRRSAAASGCSTLRNTPFKDNSAAQAATSIRPSTAFIGTSSPTVSAKTSWTIARSKTSAKRLRTSGMAAIPTCRRSAARVPSASSSDPRASPARISKTS